MSPLSRSMPEVLKWNFPVKKNIEQGEKEQISFTLIFQNKISPKSLALICQCWLTRLYSALLSI